MGYYDSEYEKYYGSLRRKLNYAPGCYGGRVYNKENCGNKKRGYLVKRIIRDLIGVLVLFIFIILCKVTSNPQARSVYNYSKSIINENYNYSKLKTQLNSININYVGDNIKNTIKELRVNGEK
ncbi:endopeptidase [Clostridium sp.]|uniref:endopeptidase n=1 Tax=Clostridium sp. TaxID=1506 RepID=UPI0035A09D8E